MGIRATLDGIHWLNSRRDVDATNTGRPVSGRDRLALPSPWQSGALSPIVWEDVFGLALPTITREQAMTIPGVARARGILLSLIADKPLVGYVGNVELDPQPLWLYRVPGWQGPWRRMAATLDDHMFHGWALWGVKRGYAGAGLEPILEAWHIPYDDWEVDAEGRICLVDEDGQFRPVDAGAVLLLPGPSEGLLAYASRSLRGAVELEQAWIARAKNPIPVIDLHQTVEAGLQPDEAQSVVDAWATARSDPNGAIAYTPFDIEARALGQYAPDMFIEARNAVRLDLAAFFQLPGSLLDATTATASLTYSTQESSMGSVDSMTVPYWIRPIEDRLSQDDVVPRGQIVRFNFSDAYTEPPGPIVTTEAAAAAAVASPYVEPYDAENPDDAVPDTPTGRQP